MSASAEPSVVPAAALFRPSLPSLVAVAVFAALAWFVFRGGIENMLGAWGGQEEYSHAYIIPLIAAFLVWQKRNELAAMPFDGSWAGVAVVVAGVLLGLLGELATVFTIQQIGLMVAISGLVLALVGWKPMRYFWMPLLLLFLVIPLPNFIQVKVSSGMQLISSAIGVWFLRLMDISVFLEGNVIDLGTYQLQVVEACDGLRYLFPLMTLGLVIAWFYQGATWKRWLLFFSSIPITILMNSIRIAMIGLMVEHWGIGMAEGFLHDFQGWAVFVVSFALMVLLMIGLSMVGKDRKPWRELFGLEFPAPLPKGVPRIERKLTMPVIASVAALSLGALVAWRVPDRAELIPPRPDFVGFPMVISGWLGERSPIEQQVIDVLQFDDYVKANFRGPAKRPVNFYVAWYDTQRSGKSVHSPSTCLPGGGWKVEQFEQVTMPGVEAAGGPLTVNRAVMAMGDSKQIVYYWFQQRGRVMTNEYLVKWYLFWDGLTRRRSDGALVRVSAPLGEGETVESADRDLQLFIEAVQSTLEDYLPR
jgi:exosortase D (VPLPA-CTERM-specific)